MSSKSKLVNQDGTVWEKPEDKWQKSEELMGRAAVEWGRKHMTMQQLGPNQLSFGQLPNVDAYDRAFAAYCQTQSPEFPSPLYVFENDARVGSSKLTKDVLWAELACAQDEWNRWLPSQTIEGPKDDGGDFAGDWCAAVLGVLGFEWV